MTNYTVKLVLRDHVFNAKNESPIYLRITIARKTAYIATGHFVQKDNWNSKTESIKNGKTINPELASRKNEVIKKIVQLQVAGKEITAKSLKALFTGKDLTNIFDFIEQFCIEVKHKRDQSTINVYEKHSRKLELFVGSRVLMFEEITHDFLARYETSLRNQGLSNNYIHAIWKTLKTFFNAAKKRGLISNYPFATYENPIYKNPVKDYLTLDELKLWEKFADETTNMVHKQAAVYFLLGCYSGIRISDWLTFDVKKHIVDGRLLLRAKKNGEFVGMNINKPLQRNLERIKRLPLTIEEPTLNEKLKIIAKDLKIKKNLSSHAGRRTFAITMCAEQGISSETCAELMGITIATCVENYYRVTNRKIDLETTRAWQNLK